MYRNFGNHELVEEQIGKIFNTAELPQHETMHLTAARMFSRTWRFVREQKMTTENINRLRGSQMCFRHSPLDLQMSSITVGGYLQCKPGDSAFQSPAGS